MSWRVSSTAGSTSIGPLSFVHTLGFSQGSGRTLLSRKQLFRSLFRTTARIRLQPLLLNQMLVGFAGDGFRCA